MANVYGVDMMDVPDGATPIEAVVILKALDENGELVLYRRASGGLAPWDIVGLLTVILDGIRDEAQCAGDVDFVDDSEE